MMTVRVSSLIFFSSCRGYEFTSALSSVSTFVLLVRVDSVAQVDCFDLFCSFPLSFSLAFGRPIICSFSLLQKPILS